MGYCTEVKMTQLLSLEAVKIIGAILGILSFAWRIYDETASYLHIELTIEDATATNSNYILANVKVENKSKLRKKIDHALILVSPEDEKPTETYNKLTNSDIEEISSIFDFDNEHIEAIYGEKGRAMILLPFFYIENIRIADEIISYSAPIKLEKVAKNVPYAVRFFVRKKKRLHRSTEQSFVLPNREKTSESVMRGNLENFAAFDVRDS